MVKSRKRARRATKPRRVKPRTPGRVSAESRLAELKRRFGEISDLRFANALLTWDQATYMPAGGARARARQGATLSRLAHERLVDPALGRLIDALTPYADRLSPDSDDASLVRVARRDFEKAIKVPSEHIARAKDLCSASYDAWTRARPANDFAAMVPFLEQTLELSREYAEFFGPYQHIADPLIDDADEGMTTAAVHAVFAELRRELVPMVRAIAAQPMIDNSCLRGSFAQAPQLDFNIAVIDRMGYDRARGRLDTTLHPFCTKFSLGDVRITTRFDENAIDQALFSTVHELGHGIYEQGVTRAFEGTPLGSGSSSGVHEKASRGCGKTWSAAAAASGCISFRCCRKHFPISSP